MTNKAREGKRPERDFDGADRTDSVISEAEWSDYLSPGALRPLPVGLRGSDLSVDRDEDLAPPEIVVSGTGGFPFQLGVGVLVKSTGFEVTTGSPFTSTQVQPTQAGAATEIKAESISDFEVLHKRTRFDLNWSARGEFGAFGGGSSGSFHLEEVNEFKKSSFAFSIYGYQALNWETLTTPQLDPKAERYIDNRKEFVLRYGNYIPMHQQRSIVLNCTVYIEDIESTAQKNVNAALGAFASVARIGGAVNTSYSNFLSSLERKYRVQFRLTVRGGPGAKNAVSVMPEEGEGWNGMRRKVETFLQTWNSDNATVESVRLLPVERFGVRRKDHKLFADLSHCYLRSLEAERYLVQLKKIETELDGKYHYLLPRDKEYYKNQIDEMKRLKDDATQQGSSVVSGGLAAGTCRPDPLSAPASPEVEIHVNPFTPNPRLTRISGWFKRSEVPLRLETSAYNEETGVYEHYGNDGVWGRGDGVWEFRTFIGDIPGPMGPDYWDNWRILVFNNQGAKVGEKSLGDVLRGF